MKRIIFISNNPIKFNYFSENVKINNFIFEQKKTETSELQADNNRIIAEFSAQWAAKKLQEPVIKEDVGVYIESLNRFPGPFINSIENKIYAEGFIKLLEGSENRNAYWEYAIAFCEPDKSPISFYTHQRGTISYEKRGNSGFEMDKIFIPEGQTQTTAELLDENKYIRNNSHYKDLKEYLEKLNEQ